MTLPALGESVTEGTVTRWLKQVGDAVAVDEALLEVSTDKVDTEIPSPVAGTLLEIKVDEDETVEVGAELAVIGDEGAAPSGGDATTSSRRQEQPSRAEEPEPEQKPSRSPSRSPSQEPSRSRAGAPSSRPPGSRSRRRSSRPPRPRRRAATSRPATSRRWSARWPPSTASTWRP